MKPVLDETTTDLKRMRNICWTMTLASLLTLAIFVYLTWVIGAEASWGYFTALVVNIYTTSTTISSWRYYFDVKSFVNPR